MTRPEAGAGARAESPPFSVQLIRRVERVGNLLPHPFTVFLLLIALVVGLSVVLSWLGAGVTYETMDAATGETATTTVKVVSLASRAVVQGTMQNFVQIYASFVPVGFVIIMVLGVSLAEGTGFFSAVIRTAVQRTPPAAVTFVIALVGICSNIASDAGIIISSTLGGAIFLALNRHPVAGVCTGYVAAYGGFSANFFISGTDVVLAGITRSAAGHFAVDAPIHPLMNWYCMMASTVVLATVVTVVTEKVVIPYLGEYRPPDGTVAPSLEEFRLTDAERRGLAAALVASLAFLVVMLVLTMPQGALLRNADGKLLPSSPLISGIIFILFVYFLVVGVAYGVAAGTLRSQKEIPKMMEGGLVGVAGFLVVCLPASLFIDLFNKSNLTTLIAVRGADLVRGLDVGMVPTLMVFALLCASINLFITSGFTKWLILAPIFIPLFYQLGVSPAMVQMSYRIGDSTTNVISPVSAYLPFLLGLLEKYRNKDQEVGIGSAMALTLPYSVGLLVVWVLFLGLWLLLGLDPGPGVPIHVSAP